MKLGKKKGLQHEDRSDVEERPPRSKLFEGTLGLRKKMCDAVTFDCEQHDQGGAEEPGKLMSCHT